LHLVPPTTPTCSGLSLLRVSKLSVTYGATSLRPVAALQGVDLEIRAGEIIGLLGESSCGKSTLAMSLLGLLPAGTRVEGEIFYRDNDLSRFNERQLRSMRGAKISMIHQEPGLSLSPVMKVGEQIAEVIRAHFDLDRNKRRAKVLRILNEVHLPDAERVYSAYPHQLSGGELHRVAIAQALVCQPDLVIADESTRSLDGRTQTGVLRLLADINREFGMAILFITHNPALLAGFAQRVLVMRDGSVVEAGETSQIFRHPRHPYTKALLQLVPQSLQDDLVYGD
jgi:ABC-type dipeptide/oligopeptide/nickel transport system ATPase component